jgi:hypothetical protein
MWNDAPPAYYGSPPTHIPCLESSSYDSGTGITTDIYRFDWDTTPSHNGNHILYAFGYFSILPTATVSTEDYGGTTVTNLAITSCVPEGVAPWKGEEGTTVPIQVNIEDNDTSDPMTLTLTLYATNADNRGPWTGVRTMTANNVTGSSYTFYWDGKDDNGAYVEPWTYTFEVDITQTDINYNENPALQVADDTEYRSRYLHILRSRDAFNNPIYEAEYAGYDEGDPNDPNDDSYLYYIRFYDLKDILDVDASEGELWLYDTTFNIIRTWDVASLECLASGHSGGDGLDASSTGITHDLLVPVPINDDAFIFVLHIKDDHPYKYRDHRERWALNLNSFIAAIKWIKITQANGTAYPNGFTEENIYVTRNNYTTPPSSSPPVLTVKGKVTPARSGIKVAWFFEDPDEPAGHVPDDTDTVGNDNNGTDAGYYNGFPFTPNPTWTSTTDVNGETEVSFSATTYGGDNFKLCARVQYDPNNPLSVGKYKVTQTVTVWKQIVFEIEDHLEDYAYDPSNIAHELRQVYVEREETYGTGDIIPTTDSRLSQGNDGAYWQNGVPAPFDLAQAYDDDPNTDYQLIVIRAESQALNYLRHIEKEPYSSTINYEHNDAASGAMDWATRATAPKDDLAPEENGNTALAHKEGPNQVPPFFILMYKDQISADALCLGVEASTHLKNTLWHETGHLLGLNDGLDSDYDSIMNQIPQYAGQDGQDDLDYARNLMISMHWSDGEAAKVRRDYVPNGG